MKRQKNPDLAAYLRKQVKAGNFTDIAAPETRGEDQWALISDQHGEDRAFEAEMNLQLADPFSPALMNPARNLRKIVQVPRPQWELGFKADAPRAEEVLVGSERDAAQTFTDNRERDHLVLELINAGDVTFEQLTLKAGSSDEVIGSLKRLRRRNATALGVQTISGLVTFEKDKIVAAIVRSEEKETVEAQYIGINTKAKSATEVYLSVIPRSSDASAGSTARASEDCVRLDTRNNVRTLKILEASRFFDVAVPVVLGWHFAVGAGKRIRTLEEVLDEVDVLSRIGPLARYIPLEDS